MMRVFVFLVFIAAHYSCVLKKGSLNYYPGDIKKGVSRSLMLKHANESRTINGEDFQYYSIGDRLRPFLCTYYVFPMVGLDTNSIKEYNGKGIKKYLYLDKKFGVGGAIVKRFGRKVGFFYTDAYSTLDSSLNYSMHSIFYDKDYDWDCQSEAIMKRYKKMFIFRVSYFSGEFWAIDKNKKLWIIDQCGNLVEPDEYFMANYGLKRIQFKQRPFRFGQKWP